MIDRNWCELEPGMTYARVADLLGLRQEDRIAKVPAKEGVEFDLFLGDCYELEIRWKGDSLGICIAMQRRL
jgi:hypothetical protein